MPRDGQVKQQVPIQQVLFPADEEEQMLLDHCTRYAKLTDTGKALVKGYLKVQRGAAEDTRQGWLDASGLHRSTGYRALGQVEKDVWPAIVEALQLCGQRAALRGAFGLFVSGMLIQRSLLAGERSTETLTAVERDILRDCAQAAGILPRLGLVAAAATTDPKTGRRMGLAFGAGGDLDSMMAAAAAVDELIGGQARTLGEAAPSQERESVPAAPPAAGGQALEAAGRAGASQVGADPGGQESPEASAARTLHLVEVQGKAA